ncbi:MAG: alpha/beta fold hydrolase [Acidimicrobiia bacterium]
MRKFLLGVAAALGLMRLFPEVLKRHMAPPQRPQPHTPADLGLPEVPIMLRSASGTDLHAWFIPAGGEAPAVVVLHGWGANASLMLPLAPHLHRAGLHSLFLDARNHGRSEHDDFVSMPRFAEDLDVAIDWLAQHDDVTTVGVIGHSVGAGAALLVGSRRSDLGAIVSVSAFAHPGEIMAAAPPMSRMPAPVRSGMLRTMERTIGARFDDIAPRSTIGRVKAPLILVHGDADRVVPLSNMHELARRAPDARILVVPGADHASLDAFEHHVDTILGFLSEHLG